MLRNIDLSNRDFAWLIILMLFVLWGLSKRSIRKSLLDLLKCMIAIKVLNIFLIYTLYVELMTVVMHSLGVWTMSSIKETLIWILLVPIPVLAKSMDVSFSFKRVALDQITLTVVVSYIISHHSFSLVFELMLCVVIIILSTIYAMSVRHRNQASCMMFVIGLVLFAIGLHDLIINFDYTNARVIIMKFLVSPMYTLFVLPLTYLIAVFMAYEVLFMRCDFMLRHNSLSKKSIKRAIVAKCRLNLTIINKLSSTICNYTFQSMETFNSMLNELN